MVHVIFSVIVLIPKYTKSFCVSKILPFILNMLLRAVTNSDTLLSGIDVFLRYVVMSMLLICTKCAVLLLIYVCSRRRPDRSLGKTPHSAPKLSTSIRTNAT